MSSSLSSIAERGQRNCLTSSDQNNPLAGLVEGSRRIFCAYFCTNGHHPEIVRIRERLELQGTDVLPEHDNYQVINIWCNGHQPGHPNRDDEGIKGINGRLPCYVYIINFSEAECVKNKLRITEYGSDIFRYFGQRPVQSAERSGRTELLTQYAPYDVTNFHHFIRTLGYVVIRAKHEHVFSEPLQGHGFNALIYECVFAVNKEGLNARQHPDYVIEGDSLGGVIAQYSQEQGHGHSFITGRDKIIAAPTALEKYKALARELINKFSVNTRIYQLAEDFLTEHSHYRVAPPPLYPPPEISCNYATQQHSAAAEPEVEHVTSHVAQECWAATEYEEDEKGNFIPRTTYSPTASFTSDDIADIDYGLLPSISGSDYDTDSEESADNKNSGYGGKSAKHYEYCGDNNKKRRHGHHG